MAKTVEQLNTEILLSERYRDRCKEALANCKAAPGSTALNLLGEVLTRAEGRVKAAEDKRAALIDGRKYHCFRPIHGRMLCVKCSMKYGGLFDESQCPGLDKASNTR